MSIRELIYSGPRNVRKNLFRDIILIILITACSIVIISLYRGLSVKDNISAQIISDASRLIQKRFIIFLTPFDSSLRVLAKIGESSGLHFDISQKNRIETLFVPFLDVYKELGKISIIGDSGDYITISRTRSGHDTISGTDNKALSLLSTNVYRGAIAASKESPVFWFESFTSNHEKSGISASIQIKLADGAQTGVIAFFIPADKIISFISDIDVPENVDIILFNKKGMFLSKNQLFSPGKPIQSSDQVTLSGSPEIEQALELWKARDNTDQSVTKFKSGAMTWWAGFTPVEEKRVNAWVSVIVPESEIINDVYQHWYSIALPLGVILIFAVFMTLNLIRRYSFQLKDLPPQQIIDADLKDSIRRLVHAGESSTLEFKSTMRKNLKTGKFGKEIEIAWLKSVTAFMNSDGGVLVIGVDDDGQIVGMDDDEFANEDKCRLHFKNLINSHIGPSFSRYLHLKICSYDDTTVLVIECERVRRPVFLNIGKSEDFYIRSGPSSMKLSMSAMVTYLAER